MMTKMTGTLVRVQEPGHGLHEPRAVQVVVIERAHVPAADQAAADRLIRGPRHRAFAGAQSGTLAGGRYRSVTIAPRVRSSVHRTPRSAERPAAVCSDTVPWPSIATKLTPGKVSRCYQNRYGSDE